MDRDGSSFDAEICPNAAVKLEPLEFVVCERSEVREGNFCCQINETYEESKENGEIKEETGVTADYLTNSEELSFDLLRLPSVNKTNDGDPFAEAGNEEESEGETSLDQKATLARDHQGKSSKERFNETNCHSQSERDNFISDKGMYGDRPQTPISAFFKEERSFEDSSDEQSEIVKVCKSHKHSSRSSCSSPGSLECLPVLLLSPKNLKHYSVCNSKWNEQLIDDQSSSSSSASLGYDSGSEDLSYQEQKCNLYCPQCNKAFLDKVSFNNHSEVYHGRGTKCDHCNRSFRSKKKLKMHKENLLKCHEFIRSGKLSNDRALSRSNYENPPKVSLRLVPTHKLMSGVDDLKSNEDNKAFVDERLIDNAANEDRSPKGVGTNSNPILIDENSTGSEGSTVCCKICRNVFLNKNDLKIHFLAHTERKDCKCNHCGKFFKSEKELYTHTENLLTGHTFLKSGQVSHITFYGEQFHHQEVNLPQKTIDEDDIKPITVLDEGDVVSLLSSPDNS